jgi:DNA-binding transcriptional LysR family regulator
MNINAIDLRQLRYFVAVAEELHFGRAARRLNMSQPPLSQQIKALENFLGVVLFHRTNRCVELTPAGYYFLPEAKKILLNIVQVAEMTKHAEAGLTGRLRIGVNFSAPFHPFTSKLLQDFRERYPHIQTELILYERANVLQLADIQSSDLDLALIWLDDAHDKADIMRLDLAHDEMQAVVPSNHELAGKPYIDIQDLDGLPFISQPRHAGTQRYDCIMAAFASINAYPRTMYEPLQMPLVMSMVAAGQGVSLLPAFLQNLPIAGVTFRPLKLPGNKIPHMTYNLIGNKPFKNEAIVNFISVAEALLVSKFLSPSS